LPEASIFFYVAFFFDLSLFSVPVSYVLPWTPHFLLLRCIPSLWMTTYTPLRKIIKEICEFLKNYVQDVKCRVVKNYNIPYEKYSMGSLRGIPSE